MLSLSSFLRLPLGIRATPARISATVIADRYSVSSGCSFSQAKTRSSGFARNCSDRTFVSSKIIENSPPVQVSGRAQNPLLLHQLALLHAQFHPTDYPA